ncbi:UPF0764 protein C16orf89 homolog isoform X1 [Cotesia glomerata]|uniref:UPF0764 protein C16orf89 homolog isoform X1 n=1 Tax=Cotesia glomerata TaxID=32391 RepID=UPI001D020D56|nr:UPF0764 protein C16orf89 homolog isoform X1 [Cotesia glomerata]
MKFRSLVCWALLGFCGVEANYFANILNALYQDVKFINQSVDQVNLDCIFGVALAEANLIAVLSSNNEFLSNDQWDSLNEIVSLCRRSRNYFSEQLIAKNDSFLNQMKILLQPEIWIKPINWHFGILNSPFKSNFTLSEDQSASLIMKGTPQEPESDYCIAELSGDNCRISNICMDMLLRKDGSRGYPLTHRVLYVQTAKALQCTENYRANLTDLTENYCRDIFNDLIELEFNGFPSMSQDLIMEQIFLCGMEGFLEFANEHYGNLIIRWQNSHGCFSSFNSHTVRSRSKRETNPLDYGCDSHATGVAAAALSVLIREFIEN